VAKSKVRAVAIVVPALIVAGLVVRVAAVQSSPSSSLASAIWPGHPAVIFASGLAEIGNAAIARKPVGKPETNRLIAAATKAPLAPEPFLVRGVEAQISGNPNLAGGAFGEAARRDPRSMAARYFLADHYLRTGQTRLGLGEISALTRIVPESLDGVAPYLASYARSPGAAEEVRRMLRRQPRLEPVLLNTLAANARDANLALRLWSGRGGDEARPWQQRLLSSLVEAGRYAEAEAAWRRFGGAAKTDGEDLADFSSTALAPFGWSLVSGPAGVAEPDEGGRLRILYYGRDNLALASRLLMLKPGRYRLSMRVSNASPGAESLAWVVRCLPSSNQLAALGLQGANKRVLTGSWDVPPTGCEAQWLELIGTSPDFPQQTEATISEFRLSRGGGS
jgi:hypothetical protein